jgi:hypothetical protein
LYASIVAACAKWASVTVTDGQGSPFTSISSSKPQFSPVTPPQVLIR